MEVQTDNKLAVLDEMQPESMVAFEERMKEQGQLVKENPFIKVGKDTYKTAKERRTALKTGRTSIQNEVRMICSKLSGISRGVKEKGEELIDITIAAENKQQEAIDTYETKLNEEKERKRQEEEARISAMLSKLSQFKEDYLVKIMGTVSSDHCKNLKQEISLIQFDPDEYMEYIGQAETYKTELLSRADNRIIQLKEIEDEKLEMFRIQYKELFEEEPDEDLDFERLSDLIKERENAMELQEREAEIALNDFKIENNAKLDKCGTIDEAVDLYLAVKDFQFDPEKFNGKMKEAGEVKQHLLLAIDNRKKTLELEETRKANERIMEQVKAKEGELKSMEEHISEEPTNTTPDIEATDDQLPEIEKIDTAHGQAKDFISSLTVNYDAPILNDPMFCDPESAIGMLVNDFINEVAELRNKYLGTLEEMEL